MKRSFAILLALITLLVGCLPALADVDPANIDPSTKGSLHIVKYEYNMETRPPAGRTLRFSSFLQL